MRGGREGDECVGKRRRRRILTVTEERMEVAGACTEGRQKGRRRPGRRLTKCKVQSFQSAHHTD